MPVQDQAVWRSVAVVTSGERRTFHRGDLLPPPSSEQEANTRALLRLGGALRVVEVVFTPDELAARGKAAKGPAATASAAGVTATVSPTGQDPRGADPVGNAPTVLGPKPAAHATKREWVSYAVAQGMPPSQAEAQTRDELHHHYADASEEG